MDLGEILVSRYGYSVSLVKFYKIIRKTAKTVTLQEMKYKFVSSDGYNQQGFVEPTNEKEDTRIISRRVLDIDSKSPYVKIDNYSRAYLWDKKAVWYDSCD